MTEWYFFGGTIALAKIQMKTENAKQKQKPIQNLYKR